MCLELYTIHPHHLIKRLRSPKNAFTGIRSCHRCSCSCCCWCCCCYCVSITAHMPFTSEFWQPFLNGTPKIWRFCDFVKIPKEFRSLNGNFDIYVFSFAWNCTALLDLMVVTMFVVCRCCCCHTAMAAFNITITQWLTQMLNLSSIILSKHSKIIWINFEVRAHTHQQTHTRWQIEWKAPYLHCNKFLARQRKNNSTTLEYKFQRCYTASRWHGFPLVFDFFHRWIEFPM